jgi:hypothetical protein
MGVGSIAIAALARVPRCQGDTGVQPDIVTTITKASKKNSVCLELIAKFLS